MDKDTVINIALFLGIMGFIFFLTTLGPTNAEKNEAWNARSTAAQLPCIEDGGTIELVGSRYLNTYCAYPDGTKLRIFVQ